MKATDEKTFIYYIRGGSSKESKGIPIACVMFYPHENGTVSRGVSICSKKDPWNKRKARGIAEGRLLKAMRNNQDSDKIRWQHRYTKRYYDALAEGLTKTGVWGIVHSDDTNKLYTYKAIACDSPTDFEKRMLEKV